MKVVRLNGAAPGLSHKAPALVLDTAARPEPGEDELLIRVCAAGVTPTELLWYPTSHTKSGGTRSGAVPGHEFSGIIEATGKNGGGLSEI